MRVTVSFRPKRRPDESFDLPSGATVGDLVTAAGQSTVSTLVVRGGHPVPEDAPLSDGDEVLLLSSFSGG